MDKRIGCILSVTKDKYRDPYFMSIYAGVEARPMEKGYSIAFLKTYYEVQEPETLRAILEAPPAGIILMEQLPSLSFYRSLRARIPACVGIDTRTPDIDIVGYDHFDAGMHLANHLIKKGHQKIAFWAAASSGRRGRRAAATSDLVMAMYIASLPDCPEWVLDCQWDEISALIWLKADGAARPPTAICAASDLMAMAALSALYSIGIRVPEQVAVIGLSNIQLSQFSSPP